MGPSARLPGTRETRFFIAAAVSGAACVAVALIESTGPILGQDGWGSAWPVAVWWPLFAVAAACVLRAPRRPAVILVLVLAVAMRLAALADSPRLSRDLERYAWDGRVQAAGIDPYRYPPDSPRLARLRDPWLWPGPAGCAAQLKPPGCTLIDRRDARTIYPPVAQAWFVAVTTAAGSSGRERSWQIAGLLLDLALLAVLLALLRSQRRDPRLLVLYAWSPVAVLEATQNGHVDGLAALTVLGALALLRRRPGLAGAVLGVATLVKLYPALLLPLWVGRDRRRGILAWAAVVVIAYVPHVLSVGVKVLGYLPDYLQEEGYSRGSRFRLLDLVGITGTTAQVIAAALLALVVAGVLRSARARSRPEATAALLLGALLLIATPVQPWYALSLAALAALSGQARWLAVAAAGYVQFFEVLLHGDRLLGQLAYLAALITVLVAAGRSGLGGATLLSRTRRVRGSAVSSP